MTPNWAFLAVFLAVYALLPALIFVHECGHAVPALLTGGTAHVVVGDTEGRTADFGPLRVTVGWDGPLSLTYFGYCRWDGVESPPVALCSHLGGPGVTVLVIAVLVSVLDGVANGVVRSGLTFVLINQLITLVLTLVPVRYPSWFGKSAVDTSDGYKVLRVLREFASDG